MLYISTMKKEILQQYVEKNYSQRKIASSLNVCQSTIRYWLNVHKLKTVYINKVIKPKCLNCENTVPRNPNIYCGQRCQLSHQYKLYIERWLNKKETGNISISGNLKTSNYIKRWIRETRGEKCEKCGWKKINKFTNKIPLQVNHIDGNSENTVPENIELLCPSCHSLTSTFGGANRGNGRKNRYKK